MLRRLKNRLIDLGLRQRDLARMVQLSEPEVSDIIRGIRTPGPDLKRRISCRFRKIWHSSFRKFWHARR